MHHRIRPEFTPGRAIDVSCTPFYLEEDDIPRSMIDVERCYESYKGLEHGDLRTDDHMPPVEAEHIPDLHLLRQLRVHP